jgi:hypothetical protein
MIELEVDNVDELAPLAEQLGPIIEPATTMPRETAGCL